MGLPESIYYQSTWIQPKLDAQHRRRCYHWARGFWIFWGTAKMFTSSQWMLVHTNEKWFFAIVIRRHNKCIPFFGVYPVNHAIRHKSHIDKTMVIASTAFEPRNNDVEKGGRAHKVSFTRVGAWTKAQKDSYKRIYRDDGSYHYPKIAGNRLQKKGDDIWKNLEITGSNENNGSKAEKCSLKIWLRKSRFPGWNLWSRSDRLSWVALIL
jgi:hypothetical protein